MHQELRVGDVLRQRVPYCLFFKEIGSMNATEINLYMRIACYY